MDSKTLAALQSSTAVQMAAALTPFVCTCCLVQRKGKATLEVHCVDVSKKRIIQIRWLFNIMCHSKMKKVHFISESAFRCELSPSCYTIPPTVYRDLVTLMILYQFLFKYSQHT